jgi:hypothetical protein
MPHLHVYLRIPAPMPPFGETPDCELALQPFDFGWSDATTSNG